MFACFGLAYGHAWKMTESKTTVAHAQWKTIVKAREKSNHHEILDVLSSMAKALKGSDKVVVTTAINRYSELFGHDPYLILAVIQTESDFRREVVSNKGAVGLMQVRPFVARGLANELDLNPDMAARSLVDPEINVMIGAHYLAKLIRRFGNLQMALEAYNLGPTRLRERLNNGDELSKKYSRKVLRRWKRITRMAGREV
jgi:soluble lytic murein transglycosylase